MLFVIDFDGTLSKGDTVDAMLERFADAKWKTLEEEWLEGKISAIECMQQQLDLVHADRVTLENFFRGIQLDSTFTPFYEHISQFSKGAIVSDGLDHAIEVATYNAKIPKISIFANHLNFKTNGVLISYPLQNMNCKAGNGVCKCQVAENLAVDVGGPIILVGDGKSDYCIAKHADVVFAKGKLATFCEKENIPYTPFETFAEIQAIVETWDISQQAIQNFKQQIA